MLFKSLATGFNPVHRAAWTATQDAVGSSHGQNGQGSALPTIVAIAGGVVIFGMMALVVTATIPVVVSSVIGAIGSIAGAGIIGANIYYAHFHDAEIEAVKQKNIDKRITAERGLITDLTAKLTRVAGYSVEDAVRAELQSAQAELQRLEQINRTREETRIQQIRDRRAAEAAAKKAEEDKIPKKPGFFQRTGILFETPAQRHARQMLLAQYEVDQLTTTAAAFAGYSSAPLIEQRLQAAKDHLKDLGLKAPFNRDAGHNKNGPRLVEDRRQRTDNKKNIVRLFD